MYPPNMSQIWQEYYYACENIMKQVLMSFTNILNLTDKHFFEEKMQDHMSILRASYYPHIDISQDIERGYRCSEHSDWGILTLLRQDHVGGLQVKLKKKERQGGNNYNNYNDDWFDVVSDFYDFVINIGDAMQRWTNDKFVSTKHRVVLKTRCGKNILDNDSNERYSLAYFQHFGKTKVIKTFDSCLNENGESKYQPITFEQHHAYKRHKVYANN